MRKQRIDMTGQRHARLVGLSYSHTERNHAFWLFACDCGQQTIASGAKVRAGVTLSCGCYHRQVCSQRLMVHGWRAGKQHGPTYRAWQAMKTACLNPAAPGYRKLGARGIGIDPAWLEDFPRFLADMGTRPAHHILNRNCPDGDFSPANCCWSPKPSVSGADAMAPGHPGAHDAMAMMAS